MPSIYDAPLRQVPSIYAPQPVEENPFMDNVTNGGELIKGLRRGLTGAMASLQGFGGQVLEPFAPDMSRAAFEAAQANNAAIQQSNPAKFQNFDQVHSLGDFVDYGAGAFGEGIPSTAVALGGALLGRGLGAATGARAGGFGQALAGGATGMFPLEAGEQANVMQQDPAAMANTTPWQRVGLAGGKGVVNSVLEAAPEALGVGTMFKPVSRGLMGALGAVGRGTAQGALAEGPLTEGPQEAVGQYFHSLANPQRDTSQDWADIKEASIRGSFVGGPLGAVHGGTRAVSSNIGGPAGDAIDAATPYAQRAFASAKDMAGQAKEAIQPELDLIGVMAENFKQYGMAEGLVRNEDLASRHVQDRQLQMEMIAEAKAKAAGTTSGRGAAPTQVPPSQVSPAQAAEAKSKGRAINDMLNEVGQRGEVYENVVNDMPHLMDTFNLVRAEFPDMPRKDTSVVDRLGKKTNRTPAEDVQLREALIGSLRTVSSRLTKHGNSDLKSSMTTMLDGLLGNTTGEGKASRLVTSTQHRDAIYEGLKYSMRNSGLDDAVYSAVGRAGRTQPEDAGVVNFLAKTARALAFTKMRGPRAGETEASYNAKLREAAETYKAYVHDQLGASGAELISFLHNIPSHTQKDSAKTGVPMVRGEVTSPLEYVQSQMLDPKGKWESVFDVVDKYDDMHERAIESAESFDPDDLRVARDLELRKLVKGDLGKVVHAIRLMSPDYSQVLGRKVSTLDTSEFSGGGSKAQLDDLFNENRDEDGNVTGLQVHNSGDRVGGVSGEQSDAGVSAPAKWERVADQDVAISGHASPDHPEEYGERGSEYRRINSDYEVHMANSPSGKKPTSQRGGYADIGTETAQSRARQIAAETGQDYDDVLTEEGDKVISKMVADSARWRQDLEDNGVDVNAAMAELSARYDLAGLDQQEAFERGDAQDAFDTRKILHDLGYSDKEAIGIASVYWADKKSSQYSEPGKGAKWLFDRFKYSYHLTRSKSGGHEELGEHEIDAALVSEKQHAKMKGVSAKDGYITAKINGEDGIQFFDLSRMMERSIGKVRDRTETLNDEEGSWNIGEPLDRNLVDEDGKPNNEYIKTLRSAWAATMSSLRRSEGHELTAETRALLDNPPGNMLLVRGVDGAGDVRYRDIARQATTSREASTVEQGKRVTKKISVDANAQKEVSFGIGEAQKSGILLSAEAAPANRVDGLRQGLVSGYKDEDGNAVTIDMPALVRATAKKLKVDMANPSRDALFQLAKEGIDSLLNSGHIQGPPMLSTKGQTIILATPFHSVGTGTKLFDRTAYDDTGKPIRDNTTTVSVGLKDAERAFRASRFSLDTYDQTLSKLAGITGLMEGELRGRQSGRDSRVAPENHPLARKLVELDQALTQAQELVSSMQTEGGKKVANAKVHAVLAQIAEVRTAVDNMAPEADTGATTEPFTAPNKTNIKTAINADRNAQIERRATPLRRKLRDNLKADHVDELRGKLENLYTAMESLRGQDDADFVAEHGHDVDEYGRVRMERQTPAFESDGSPVYDQRQHIIGPKGDKEDYATSMAAMGEGKRVKVDRKTGEKTEVSQYGNKNVSGQTFQFAERGTELPGKKVPGTIEGNLTAEQTAILRPGATNAAGAQAAKPPTLVSRKQDRELQTAISLWKANKRAAFQNIPDEALKAWYDVANSIDTRTAKSAAKAMRIRAQVDGIDLKTGTYEAGEFTESFRMLDEQGATEGLATGKVNGATVDIYQDGKKVGAVRANKMPELVSALNGERAADITLQELGAGVFDIHATFERSAEKMPAYHGSEDIVEAEKSQIPVPRQRVPQGEVNFKPQKVAIGAATHAYLAKNGQINALTFRGANYTRDQAMETFGAEIVHALDSISRDLANGKTPHDADRMAASPEKMTAKLTPPEPPPKGGKAPKKVSSGPTMSENSLKLAHKRLVENFSGGKFSLLAGERTPFEGSSEQVKAAISAFERMFNGKQNLTLEDNIILKDGTQAGGFTANDLTPEGKVLVMLSMAAKSHILSNTFHESMHVLHRLVEKTAGGPEIMAKLRKGVLNEPVYRRMEQALLKIAPKATVDTIMAEIRNDPEEALAYAFQLWSMGDLKLGPNTTGIMGSIAQFFRNLFRITTTGERTEAFMDAFIKGELGQADFKQSALSEAFGEKYGDHILKSVSDSLAPIGDMLHTVFDSSVEAMHRLGSEHADALAKLYTGRGEGAGFIHRKAENQRQWATHAGSVIFDKFKKAEIARGLNEVLTGDIQSDAAKAIKAFMVQMNEYAKRDPNYLPDIWDTQKIASNREKFNAAIRDFGETDTSKQIKNPIVLDILEDMGYGDKFSDKAKATFKPEYAAEKAKWLQQDPAEYMRQFINRTVNNAESKKLNLTAERERLLNKIKDEKGEAAYYKAKDAVAAWEGRLGANMDPNLRALANTAITVGNVVTLPFMIFSAAIDPFHVAARSGSMSDAFSAYMHGLASIPKTITELFGVKHAANELQKFAEDAGAIEHAMLTDSLSDIYMGDNAQGMLKKINDWYFKANFADGWTRKMRVAAVEAADRFIKAHANGNETRHSAHYLEELGLKPGDVKLRPDGRVDISDEKIRSAVNQFVYESVVRPDASTNAIWMSDQRFALLAHMKKFTFAMNSQILDRTFNELGRGNAAPLLNLLPSMGMIIAADGIKHMLKGNYDTWMKGQSMMGWLGYGMERAGFAGKFQFGLDALYDVKHGTTPIDSFLGPEYGVLKKIVGAPRMGGGSDGDLGLLGLMDDAYYVHRALSTVQQAGKGAQKSNGKEGLPP